MPPASVTFYAPVQLLTAWFKAAQPGSNVQFAAGPEVDPAEPVAQLVQEWIASGAVTQHLSGRDANGALRHVVKRAFPPSVGSTGLMPTSSSCRRSPEEKAFLDTPEGRVFRLIEEAALDGLPCPANAVLADLAELRDADAASYRIKRLVAWGRIRVEAPNPPHDRRAGRVVTIVESGLSTARWRV